MKKQHRTLIVVFVAVLTASVASFAMYQAIQRLGVREVEVAHTQVVVAAQTITMGTRLHENHLRLVDWPSRNPVPGAFSDPQKLIDRGVIVPIAENEPITANKVASLEAGWMKVASKATHLLLYVMLVTEAGLGFAFRWGAGRPMAFFGLGIPPLIGELGKALRHSLRDIHEWNGWAIIVLAGLHAAAALYHHYVLKDRVLARMLPVVRQD